MTMKNKLYKLNLQKYLPFLKLSEDNDFALGIYGKAGEQYELACSDHSENLQDFFQQTTPLSIAWGQLGKENNILLIDNVGYIQFVTLVLGSSEKEFWLVACHKTDKVVNEIVLKDFFNSLVHLANCLKEDYVTQQTVTDMADELVVRYEELNLLYGMDDIESFYKKNDEQTSLSQLIKNCVDYLNIDLGIIIQPEQNRYLTYLGVEDSLIDPATLKQTLCNELYLYLSKRQETVVINHDSQIDWTDANVHTPYKLIAAPIVTINQRLCGMLLLINRSCKVDFSKSDRKLTEVLASEASKLIQVRRDPTTGTLNRRGFNEQLEHTIETIKTEAKTSCLLFVDIDQFKLVNETSGHIGGDHLLKQISTLLHKYVKKNDVQGRLGSDEFVIILNDCELKDAELTAERIRQLISQFRFMYQGKLFDISACIGVLALNKEIGNCSQALRYADLACTVAKEQGSNKVHVYEATDEAMLKHENQMQWVTRINEGIDENKFQIYRQEIQSLQKNPGLEAHYEILIRLKDENNQILSPFHFIPVAERYNLMPKIDRWVIKKTLSLMSREFKECPETKLLCSINLSGQSFCEDGFVMEVAEQIRRSGVPPQRICFEMTETAAVSNLTQAVEFMETLKKIGCLFSLDDFGSGMSSFTYLKNLPVDFLKIDGYFVKTMMEDKIDHAMVASIHQIGSVMGLKTIAEFVENEEICNELKAMGVDYGQGYAIGKPELFI